MESVHQTNPISTNHPPTEHFQRFLASKPERQLSTQRVEAGFRGPVNAAHSIAPTNGDRVPLTVNRRGDGAKLCVNSSQVLTRIVSSAPRIESPLAYVGPLLR